MKTLNLELTTAENKIKKVQEELESQKGIALSKSASNEMNEITCETKFIKKIEQR